MNLTDVFTKIRSVLSRSTAPADPVVIKTVDPNSPNPQRPDLIDITVDGLDEAKETATWLTKGEFHNEPAHTVLLKDCTDAHLSNILLNKPNLSADYRRVIESMLQDRGVAVPVAPAALPAAAGAGAASAPSAPQQLSGPTGNLNDIV